MNVVIEIFYISEETKVYQAGDFPLRRRSKEEVAVDFWRQIKREMPYGAVIAKVLADGADVTDRVTALL